MGPDSILDQKYRMGVVLVTAQPIFHLTVAGVSLNS